MTIRGKGDKVRTAYIFNGAAAALSAWLNMRGREPGRLFYAVNKGGSIQRTDRRTGKKGAAGQVFVVSTGISDEALAQMLVKRAEPAGFGERLTWHDFRRTFAGNLLDSGADLVTVQKLMGHSSPTTTSNYDRRGDEVKRKAVRALHVPYARRSRGK